MTIQSILFDKKYYTESKAMDWLVHHNFIPRFTGKRGAHETKNKWRFRQSLPDDSKKYFTKRISRGIEFIIEY